MHCVPPISDEQARRFAGAWVAAWNARDPEAILAHYAPGVLLTSPVAARLLGEPSGSVAGIDALRAYFLRGFQAYPGLHFELLDVFHGLASVVLVYANQNGTKTAEFMEFNGQGQVVRVVANYSA